MRSKIIASLLAVACLPMPTAGAYQVHGELDRGTGQEFCVLSASDADRAAYQTYLEEVPRAWEKLRGNLRSDFPQIDFTEYDRLSEGEREAWLALNRPVIDEAGEEHRYRPFELDLRQHHKVELTISSLTFPTRVFEQKYQLKEDLWMQPDPTRGPVLYTANGGTNTAPSVATGAIPKKGGTYYLQATDFTLKIPSKNYEMTASKWNGARLNIGRFECDLFDEKLADDNKVCEFPHPVDGS